MAKRHVAAKKTAATDAMIVVSLSFLSTTISGAASTGFDLGEAVGCSTRIGDEGALDGNVDGANDGESDGTVEFKGNAVALRHSERCP